MNKKNLLCFVKRLTAGILTTGMIVGGIVVAPKQADAATVEDKVIYEEGYDITKYWDAEKSKAPVKAGYVFGGWYSAKEENAYLTYEDAKNAETAYAKFVPAQVLSVKAQNMEGTGETVTDKTHVRIISSLDSKNYTKVGFDIYLANSVKLVKDDDYTKNEPLETDKIYDGILVGKNKQEKRASEIFGGASKYVSVWQLENIDSAHWGKIIYVRPYWITKDGTKVEGLAKYVHIEDEYEGYISVPVNLLDEEKVAAGIVEMAYDKALEYVEVEEGRVLPDMTCFHNADTKTVKMVGNAPNTGKYISGETLFANVRFKKPAEDTNFEMTPVQFCNWKEETVEIDKVWDVKYDAQ